MLTVPSVGEDRNPLELSCTGGRVANCNSHLKKQFGNFLHHLTYIHHRTSHPTAEIQP